MILQSLVRLAQRERLLDDPTYVNQRVQWIVDVTADGALAGLTYTGQTPEGTRREVFQELPIPNRRGRDGKQVRPDLLVDKGLYVFGLGDPRAPAKRDRLAACARAMLDETRRIAAETGDRAVQAQALAMARVLDAPESLSAAWLGAGDESANVIVAQGDHADIRVPRRWATNHLFAFRFEGQFVARRPAVREWLTRQAEATSSDNVPIEAGELCLVTGRWARPVDNHPRFDLPGGSIPLPLVSFNQRAFEHYGRSGNENAPVSVEAALAYFTALERLTERAPRRPGGGEALPRRNLGLTGDTTVLYWCDLPDGARDDPGDDLLLAAVVDGDAEAIAGLEAAYTRPRTGGRPVILDDPTPLFSLVLTREKSRVVLRTADLHTVGAVARAVGAYLADTQICPLSAGQREHRGISRLLESTLMSSAREARPTADLATRLYRCALDARLPYPRELLAAVLGRIRAHDKKKPARPQEEHRVRRENDDLSRRRAALCRAVVNRTCRTDPLFTKELPVSLDPAHPSTAYQLGRLFAALEKAQQEATSAEAGIAERFLGTAMTAPALVFPRLLKLSQHHLAKIGGARPGRAIYFSRLLDEVVGRLPPELPGAQALVEQGSFVVGYHHQRAALWTKRDDGDSQGQANGQGDGEAQDL